MGGRNVEECWSKRERNAETTRKMAEISRNQLRRFTAYLLGIEIAF